MKKKVKSRRPFVTGSHAYGLPGKHSDVDLVMLVDQDTYNKLESRAILSKQIDDEKKQRDLEFLYEKFHSRPLWFGDLNIIACLDVKAYDMWKKGTEKLKKQAPVSREYACRYFDRLRAETYGAE